MDYLALALLGGVVGLDAVSCAQAMISRPIVAGPLAGLILGDPVAGMYAGALLELLSLRQLPIGANRGWDTGPAAVAAAVAAAGSAGHPVALAVAVGLGVLVGWAGGWSVQVMRHATAGLVAARAGRPVTPLELSARHLSAVAVDFVRAAALTLAAAWAVTQVMSAGGDLSPAGKGAAAIVLLAGGGLALGVDLGVMARGRAVLVAFGVGVVASLVFTVWLG
jgi:mannose/fructose/N-acetylgalactosamine-specific phosphotransferase system component IIC